MRHWRPWAAAVTSAACAFWVIAWLVALLETDGPLLVSATVGVAASIWLLDRALR